MRTVTVRRSDLKDLAGTRFGLWEVQALAGKYRTDTLWLCRCGCGTERAVKRGSLISGKSKSCGCAPRRNGRWTPAKALASRRRWAYRTKYGLTLSEVEAMLAAQGGACRICSTRMTLGGMGAGCAVVDHCHETGRVRGLLCSPCNTGIGQLRDSPEILAAALQYLKDFA